MLAITGRPGLDAEVVLRAGVLEILGTPGVRVVVVTAPGGYGKTSHVAAWVSQDSRAEVWLTLSPVHNDPQVLLTHLVEGLAAATDLDSGSATAFGLMPLQYPTVAASRLGHALARTMTPFVLVLDDVHLVESDASLDLLNALVAIVPPGSEIVLVGRGVRLSTLSRLRVNGVVREITIEDLAVGVDEAAQIIGRLGLEPSKDSVERMVAEVEGWPAGVRLAGLRLAHSGDGDGIGTLQGPIAHERAIADYVWSQWLADTPAEDVEFLTLASVLPWMSGPVCDHVLERCDSTQVLRRIYHDRFAVIPLARHRDSYRLHRLLQDVLIAELHQVRHDVERRLHLRASGWFETAGDDDAAVHHALAAGDLTRAERLLNEAAPRLYSSGRSSTVQRWLGTFPPVFVQNRPLLCAAAGMAALGTGDGEVALAWLRFGEHAVVRLGEAADEMERAVIATLRAMVRRDTVEDGIAEALEGCRVLPPGVWHAASTLIAGSLSWMRNDLETAGTALAAAAAEASACDAPSAEAMSRARLALVHISRGDLAGARGHATDARRVQRERGLDEMPTLHIVPAVTALLAALEGRTDVARDASQRRVAVSPTSTASRRGSMCRHASCSPRRACCSAITRLPCSCSRRHDGGWRRNPTPRSPWRGSRR